MYTCLVCGNSSYKTKYTRPELVYHRLPSNANLRKRWLEVLRIDHYRSNWQCVCGDHFLEENYRPGKRILFRNTIPQPYDQKCDQNGFPNNYTIQINDVETGNNAVLPMEQNIIIKEEDTVVNNCKAQRRSGRKLKSTRINDDMNYYEYLPRPKIEKWQIPAVIETDVKPVLTATKDRTLRYGPRCSVKKCFNRYSKELSFFGYPRDLTLRKKWIAKSGLVVSPTAIKIINRYKVCSAHFDDDCFKNTKLKNRLRPGAIPTLFVNDDIIESKNIPLTNSPVNSGFVHTNKSTCSSSNYVENVESKYTPPLIYNNSNNQFIKSPVPPALPIPIDAWRSASNAKNNLPDIIESKNIPLTNSPVNSGFFHTNKSTCSSSNYVENVESKYTPPLIYNNSNNQFIKSPVPPALPIPIDAWRSASNAKNNLPVLTDLMEVRNFPPASEFVHIYKQSSLSSDYGVNVESKDTPLLVFNTSIKDFEPYCSIPGCKSNITNTDEGPYLFAPTTECVNKWSSALGLQLTVNCCICERHFRPQDLICEEFLVDGLNKSVKLLVHSALPIPINAVGLASNARNNLPDNTDKFSKSNTSMTIDDFSNIDSNLKQKLKNISAKNSLTITLEPIKKSKVIEPSKDLFSKTSAAIKTPVISKCISLARIPDTYNSSSNKNNSTSKTFSLIDNMEYFERH